MKRSKADNQNQTIEELESEAPFEISEDLFLSKTPPEAINPEPKAKEKGILEGIKESLDLIASVDRRDEGFKEGTMTPDGKTLQDAVERIIQACVNDVQRLRRTLETRLLDIQSRIVQLEDKGFQDLAFELEEVKRSHEAILNECNAQLIDIKEGRGLVAFQLNTYKTGFNNAMKLHIMSDFKF